MGDYPHEVENCVPQLPGHIAIGVIFSSNDGAHSDGAKMYTYWAPARYARYLNINVSVVVLGMVKTVRVVSIAPAVRPGVKLKRIKTAEKPPAHLSDTYLPLRKRGQLYSEYFDALSEALGLRVAEIASRECCVRTSELEQFLPRNLEIPKYYFEMGLQAKAFEASVESLRVRTEGQLVVPVTKGYMANVDIDDNSMPFKEIHMQDQPFVASRFSIPTHPNKLHVKPPSNLELIMSKSSLSITTVTYLNGVDVSTLSNDEVFTILQDLRQRIERLESLPSNMRPARIDAELVRLQSSAKEIVDLLNNIDDVEAAAKRSDADAIRAVVKDELQAQLASYTSDARSKPNASS